MDRLFLMVRWSTGIVYLPQLTNSPCLAGTLDTMRHMKKDIDEVRKGSECGLRLHKFDDLREGDLIQAYQIIETPGVL
jgi:translation initiation factor IF-2